MTNDANLYILFDLHWKPLADIIVAEKDQQLLSDITIFQLHDISNKALYYAILTLTEKADKIVEAYGAVAAKEKDLLRSTLHDYWGEPLFGDKANLAFLMKLR